MKPRTCLQAILILLVLIASGCSTASYSKKQSQAQMAAGIHAATGVLEAEILMRFVHTPDQEFFDNAMQMLRETFVELPELAPSKPPDCPEGTTHICSMCQGSPPMMRLLGCAFDKRPSIPPSKLTQPAQTPVQMMAGIVAVTRLLDAEIQMRFVHTPNQQFFDKAMAILSETQKKLVGLFVQGRGECPPGTAHINSMCVAQAFGDRLR